MLFAAPLNFSVVAVSLLGMSSGAYAQIDGYRQVNTLLSQAYMDIIRDGQYHSICKYNAGFAWGEGIDADEVCSDNVIDPDTCTRNWDNSEEPAGILAKIVSTGKFKWCLPEADLCPKNEECVKNRWFIGVAEEDNELQNSRVFPRATTTAPPSTRSTLLPSPWAKLFTFL